MPEVITNNIDLWTSALLTKSSAGRGSNSKLEAYGIKKLRELILELAVRGKLVPQDSNDESAAKLLERIKTEKTKLVKEKKIRKDEPLPSVSDEEAPYELPQGWEWTYMGQISDQVHYGYTASADHSSTGVRMLRITDIQNNRVNWDAVPGCQIDPEAVSSYELQNGDLLIARTGGTIGKSYLVENLNLCAVFASYLIRVIPNCYSLPSYIKLYADSPLYWQQLYEKSMGTGQPNVNGVSLSSLFLPVPPLSEQHRIVAKVDELMALCDQLEQQQTDNIEVHQTLAETLLCTLTNVESHQELNNSWNRIADHFDTLFTTEQSINQLKQTILQLAVMGKLVPQDPNDEPAGVLLEKIANKKGRLVKEGKIRKQSHLPEISKDDASNLLPAGWEIVRFGSLINLISGQHLKPEEYSSVKSVGMIPYLTGPAEFGDIYPEPTRYTNEIRALAEVGDVLITCKGSGVGKTNLVNTQIAISRQLMSIQPIIVTSEFIKLLADSLEDTIRENIVGIAIPGISREDVIEAIIHLPPLAEQHRIVAKVDELMAQCDALKARLADAQTTQIHLADAIVEQAVA